jgi:predicted transcriptional regulator
MQHTYGMAIMEYRTTFALDESTIRKMKKLAGRWHVSQAEVVRRAIEQAEVREEEGITARIGRLRDYHLRDGLDAERADSYLREVAENRADWGRE